MRRARKPRARPMTPRAASAAPGRSRTSRMSATASRRTNDVYRFLTSTDSNRPLARSRAAMASRVSGSTGSPRATPAICRMSASGIEWLPCTRTSPPPRPAPERRGSWTGDGAEIRPGRRGEPDRKERRSRIGTARERAGGKRAAPGTARGTGPGTAKRAAPGTAKGTGPGTAKRAAPGSAKGTAPGTAKGTEPGTAKRTAPGTAKGTESGSAKGAAPGSAKGAARGSAKGAAPGSRGR